MDILFYFIVAILILIGLALLAGFIKLIFYIIAFLLKFVFQTVWSVIVVAICIWIFISLI